MVRHASSIAFFLFAIAASSVHAGMARHEVAVNGERFDVLAWPPAAGSRDVVVLVHGFLRTPASMSGYAQAIAREGRHAVVPALPSRVDSRANGRALSGLVASLRDGALGFPVDRVVLVGFSAGGLSAMLASGAPGIAGYVGLDAFDRPGGEGRDAARALKAPAVLVHGPPSFCNAYNISAPWRAALGSLVRERRVSGAGHCDFEWPTDAGCELACGVTHPAAQAVIREEVIGAVRHFLPYRP